MTSNSENKPTSTPPKSSPKPEPKPNPMQAVQTTKPSTVIQHNGTDKGTTFNKP